MVRLATVSRGEDEHDQRDEGGQEPSSRGDSLEQ
jgi:hypothetical protein